MVEFLIASVGIPLDVLALAKGEWGLGKSVCVATGAIVTTCGMFQIIFHRDNQI